MSQEFVQLPDTVVENFKYALPKFVYNQIFIESASGGVVKPEVTAGIVSIEKLLSDIHIHNRRRNRHWRWFMFLITFFAVLTGIFGIVVTQSLILTGFTFMMVAIGYYVKIIIDGYYKKSNLCASMALSSLAGMVNTTIMREEVIRTNQLVEDVKRLNEKLEAESKSLRSVIDKQYKPLLAMVEKRDRSLYRDFLNKTKDTTVRYS